MWLLRVMVLMIFAATALSARAEPSAEFTAWTQQFKKKAVSEGIPQDVVDTAFDGLELDEMVIKLDQKQPEKKITLEKYLSNTINTRRINKGRDLLAENDQLLRDISNKYGVQANYIVSLWGIESDFGAHKGNFSVVRSLATLAFEGRRREFFSDELIAALKIIVAEKMDPSELTGSWAGAMGNCQFMPSTYLRYAVDADGDGHRDIWNSTPDALASIANYLRSLDWKDDRGWGVAVSFPDNFKEADANLKRGHTAEEWRTRGLEWSAPNAPFSNGMTLYAIYTDQPNGVTHLVTDNFKATLQWNRSRYFATAVGTLADKLAE